MEGTHKASNFEPQDFISNVPDNVVTNIMDRLPLQDAVRTGILARNWRFKWTLLSQLVFDRNFFKFLTDKDGEDDFGKIICRLLLHLKGVVAKFVLYIDQKVEDMSHWILFLSRNGIKDLTIDKWNGERIKLPTHIFSCLELKHLKLHGCCFDPPPSFHGFPSLLSLDLRHSLSESGELGELLTHCHVLEILNITYAIGKVKLAEIAKLSNLKILSLFLCNLDNISSSSICELMGRLPKLQELDLNFKECKLTEGVVEKRFSTIFPCLKTLKLSRIDLGNGIGLSYAFQMIKSFPNLQTLQIRSSASDADPTRVGRSLDVDYNTKGLQQLRTVVFGHLKGSENEVLLITYLLSCSPLLKKVVIRLRLCVQSHEKVEFASKLLKLHRASPVVNVRIYQF